MSSFMRINFFCTILVLLAYRQANANHCVDHPCLNGGECVSNLDGYTCNCTVYFTGNKCQIRTSYCDPSHCLNGGSCYHARTIEFQEPSCFCKSIDFAFFF